MVGGPGAVNFDSVLSRSSCPRDRAVLAGLLALAATFLTYRATARADADTMQRRFKVGQVVSASTVALAHGANDAQKTMGVITLTLITAGALAPGAGPPFWVILAAGMAMALGTYMGGWRIIRTLGQRVSDLQTTQGFTAETTSAAVILTSTHLGIPLSTTQVCAGAIYGAGAGRRLRSVHWGLAGQMALGWALTLPAAAALGSAASWLAAHGAAGVIVLAVGSLALGAGIYAASRRNAVTAQLNDVPLPTARSPAAWPSRSAVVNVDWLPTHRRRRGTDHRVAGRRFARSRDRRRGDDPRQNNPTPRDALRLVVAGLRPHLTSVGNRRRETTSRPMALHSARRSPRSD